VSKQFHPLADGEVVSVQNTYRVSELAAQIRSKIAGTLAEWSNEQGVDGEALRFGSPGWEKGKVRLHLSIEFCPNEDGAQTVPSAQTANQPAAPVVNTATASAAAFGMAATHAVATTPPAAPPFMAANQIANQPVVAASDADESFDLGTMSDVSGEIDLNLSDEHSGYIDFDLSAAMPDLNLEELVANVQAGRPSLVEEVWSEIEQPNWPGVTRAQA
jgi:KGK domain